VATQLSRREYLEAGTALAHAIVEAGACRRFSVSERDGRHEARSAEDEWVAGLPADFEYRSHRVKVITESPEHGWTAGGRFWCDFALEWAGHRFFYNFKYGAGKTKDNVGGLEALGYLLGVPMANAYRAKRMSEPALRDALLKVLAGEVEFHEHREYFCLHYNKGAADKSFLERFRCLPLTAIHPEDVYVNAANGLQVCFPTARLAANPPSQKEAAEQIMRYLRNYFKKRAATYLEILKAEEELERATENR